MKFQLQHHSFQGTPRTNLLQNGLVGSPCSPRDSQGLLQHHNSKASILRCSAFVIVQLCQAYSLLGLQSNSLRRIVCQTYSPTLLGTDCLLSLHFLHFSLLFKSRMSRIYLSYILVSGKFHIRIWIIWREKNVSYYWDIVSWTSNNYYGRMAKGVLLGRKVRKGYCIQCSPP